MPKIICTRDIYSDTVRNYLQFSLPYIAQRNSFLQIFTLPIGIAFVWFYHHKSEVSTFPIDIIFFRGCVPAMFVTSYSVTDCIYVPGKPKFVLIVIVQFMMSANIRICFGLQIVLVGLYSTPSHYHHCANLSEGIELIKCLSDIFCRVCEYDSAYSLHYPLYNMWGCMFSVYPFLLWWLREYKYFVLLSSSNRKYELLPIV